MEDLLSFAKSSLPAHITQSMFGLDLHKVPRRTTIPTSFCIFANIYNMNGTEFAKKESCVKLFWLPSADSSQYGTWVTPNLMSRGL